MDKQMEMFKTIVKIMDGFIEEIGGNIDPRAVGNRDRKALYRFFDLMSTLECKAALRYMRLIINERITTHNLDGSPGFEQTVEIPGSLSQGFQVYDHLGNVVEDD